LFFFPAYYSDICVGSIACRLEKKEGGGLRVYIMTLGVLAPYRGLGIGEQITYLPPMVEIMLFDYALDSDTQTIFVNSENERCSNKSA
jgi:hypothetical protein